MSLRIYLCALILAFSSLQYAAAVTIEYGTAWNTIAQDGRHAKDIGQYYDAGGSQVNPLNKPYAYAIQSVSANVVTGANAKATVNYADGCSATVAATVNMVGAAVDMGGISPYAIVTWDIQVPAHQAHGSGGTGGDGGGDDDDDDPDPDNGCGNNNCNACCSHQCSGNDPSSHGNCDGTNGSGGCSCHSQECDCGACCSCKCTCGKWIGSCAQTCGHKCTGSGCGCQNGSPHCECHHTGDDDHDGCCEHHNFEYTPPPGYDDPGPLTNRPFDNSRPNRLKIPSPRNPGHVVPDPLTLSKFPELKIPDPKEPTALKFFERKEDQLFPEFKFEEVFKDLKEALAEKIPLDALDGLDNGVGGDFDLSWTVEFDWAGQHYGPLKIDPGKHLLQYASTETAKSLRNLVLFYICVTCLLSVLSVIFDSP